MDDEVNPLDLNYDPSYWATLEEDIWAGEWGKDA